MGVATARALAQAGRRVVLLEQFAERHDRRGVVHAIDRAEGLHHPCNHRAELAEIGRVEALAGASEVGR